MCGNSKRHECKSTEVTLFSVFFTPFRIFKFSCKFSNQITFSLLFLEIFISIAASTLAYLLNAITISFKSVFSMEDKSIKKYSDLLKHLDWRSSFQHLHKRFNHMSFSVSMSIAQSMTKERSSWPFIIKPCLLTKISFPNCSSYHTRESPPFLKIVNFFDEKRELKFEYQMLADIAAKNFLSKISCCYCSCTCFSHICCAASKWTKNKEESWFYCVQINHLYWKIW